METKRGDRAPEHDARVPDHAERPRRPGHVADANGLDLSLKPEGMSYNWKNVSVRGRPDSVAQVDAKRNFWTPVPASRHPEMSGLTEGSDTIIIAGQMLMERPEYYTEEAYVENLENAKRELASRESKFRDAPVSGKFEGKTGVTRTLSTIPLD